MDARRCEMSTDLETRNAGVAMVVVGLVGLVVAVLWLFLTDDPFPMWLIFAGGGLTFIGAGAAMRRNRT